MDQLKPGHELDLLVALALGHEKRFDNFGQPYWVDSRGNRIAVGPNPPPFSTDPGEAIKALIMFCHQNDYNAEVKIFEDRFNGCDIWRRLSRQDTPQERLIEFNPPPIYLARSRSEYKPLKEAEAICLAIVEAAGGER